MSADVPEPVGKIRALLPLDLQTTAYPVLILMSGLPGSGKSYLSERLAAELSAVIVESDRVRKALFSHPTYSARESTIVHRTCQQTMRWLLREGARVIFDATNLVEFQREMLYRLAERSGARLLIVRVVAPEDVIRERLARRNADAESTSDADWRVYRRMSGREQTIRRSHLCVDSSGDIDGAVRKVVRAVRRGTRA